METHQWRESLPPFAKPQGNVFLPVGKARERKEVGLNQTAKKRNTDL